MNKVPTNTYTSIDIKENNMLFHIMNTFPTNKKRYCQSRGPSCCLATTWLQRMHQPDSAANILRVSGRGNKYKWKNKWINQSTNQSFIRSCIRSFFLLFIHSSKQAINQSMERIKTLCFSKPTVSKWVTLRCNANSLPQSRSRCYPSCSYARYTPLSRSSCNVSFRRFQFTSAGECVVRRFNPVLQHKLQLHAGTAA